MGSLHRAHSGLAEGEAVGSASGDEIAAGLPGRMAASEPRRDIFETEPRRATGAVLTGA